MMLYYELYNNSLIDPLSWEIIWSEMLHSSFVLSVFQRAIITIVNSMFPLSEKSLTRRRSSFLLAISVALSSLDIPAVDFGTGSRSTDRGAGDDAGVGRELAAGETAIDFPSIPVDF